MDAKSEHPSFHEIQGKARTVGRTQKGLRFAWPFSNNILPGRLASRDPVLTLCVDSCKINFISSILYQVMHSALLGDKSYEVVHLSLLLSTQYF